MKIGITVGYGTGMSRADVLAENAALMISTTKR
jgi:hypothetical protein